MRILGIVLIVIGIVMMAYTGFNYVTTETVVDLGPVQIDAKKNNFVKLSPVIGGVLLAGGVIILILGKKQLA